MTAPATISVERLRATVVFNRDVQSPFPHMETDPEGQYVRHSDYAALLQQLAELERDNATMRGADYHQVGVEQEQEIIDLEAKLAEKDAEVERLRGFAQDVMESWPMGDVDGGHLQDVAVKHGLLRPVELTVPCGENCGCSEFCSPADGPIQCFRKTTLLTGRSDSDRRIAAFLAANK